jgi:hypothetical protein
MAQTGLLEIKTSQAREDMMCAAKVRGQQDKSAEPHIPQ